jgi:hypothetical protein
MLITMLLSNIFIVLTGDAPVFYTLFLTGQFAFYIAACAGWWLTLAGKRAGILTIPFYFVFMNHCLVKGFIKFLRGEQSVLWEKSERISNR